MKPLTNDVKNYISLQISFLTQSLLFLQKCLLVVESPVPALTDDKNPQNH